MEKEFNKRLNKNLNSYSTFFIFKNDKILSWIETLSNYLKVANYN